MDSAVSLAYSCASRAALFSQRSIRDNTRASGPPRRPRQPELGIAEAFDVVAKRSGFLEIEIRGGGAHVVLQFGDVGVELLLIVEALGAVGGRRRRDVVAFVDAGHHVVDRFDN